VTARAALAELSTGVDHESWAYRATERAALLREQLDQVAAVYGLASVDPSAEPAPIFDGLAPDSALWFHLSAEHRAACAGCRS